MIQILEIKFNIDGSIEADIIDRNIPQYSHKVQRIRMFIPRSVFGENNTVQIAFENDSDEEMINGYCEVAGIRDGEGGFDDENYLVYDFELTKYYTQYQGLLNCQALVGNIVDNEFVSIWESYKFNVNVVKGVKNQDYGIPDPDVASLLQGQINNLGVSISSIKSAYIKSINYDSETFTISVKKQDDTILDIDLPIEEHVKKITIDDNFIISVEKENGTINKLDLSVIKENAEARHTHNNKNVLDQIKNLGGANGVATLDSQGRLVQPTIKAEQDKLGNVINLYYQGKMLSVPIGKYRTVEECLNGLKQEIEVLIGGTITQEDLDNLKEISDAVFKAQSDIKELQGSINDVILGQVPPASENIFGVIKVGEGLKVNEGVVSVDKETTYQKIVDCDHEFEITGKTGHEYNLAVPDETTVKLLKIQGQTGRYSLQECNFADVSSKTTNGLTYSISNNVITISGTSTAPVSILSDVFDVPFTKLCLKTDFSGSVTSTNVRLEINVKVGENSYFLQNTITTFDNLKSFGSANSQGTNYNRILIYIPTGFSCNNLVIKNMLVDGDYTESNMPTFKSYDKTLVNAKCNLISTNKNLFDKYKTTDGYFKHYENGTAVSNRDYFYTDLIPVIANKQYTLSSNSSEALNTHICFYNANKDYVSGTVNDTTAYTFIIPSGVSYMVVSSKMVLKDTITIAYGNTQLAHIPHEQDTFILNEELGEFDYIDNVGHKKYKQTSNKITLNGTEDWYTMTTATSGKPRFSTTVVSGSDIYLDNNTVNVASNFIDKHANNTWNCETGISLGDASNPVFVYVEGITTVETFKQWLQSNPISFVYKKKTATITELNLPAGYKAWNGGLQWQQPQGKYLPYILTKEYAINQKAQIDLNADMNVEQQALIDENKARIEQLENDYNNLIASQTFDISLENWQKLKSSGTLVLSETVDENVDKILLNITKEDGKETIILRTNGVITEFNESPTYLKKYYYVSLNSGSIEIITGMRLKNGTIALNYFNTASTYKL